MILRAVMGQPLIYKAALGVFNDRRYIWYENFSYIFIDH